MNAHIHGDQAMSYTIAEEPFLDEGLVEGLYESHLCSHLWITLEHGETRALRITRGGKTVHLIPYVQENREFKILLKLFRIDGELLDALTKHIFATHDVDSISIDLLASKSRPRKSVITRRLQDYVLVLPESLDDYQKAIGKTTRLQIHKGINRLEKQFQDFRFRLFEKSEAEEDTLNRIIDLNHERMQMRRKASGIDSAYRNRIIDFSRKYGFVGVSSIGDRIISGSIGYKLNDTIYLAVISHDSEYDYYSPGHMTIYMTLAEAIRQKAKKVHMFWGKADYKLRFGCVPEEYVCLRIFRNRPRFLVHAGWNAVRTRSLDGLRALKRMLSLRAQWRRELPRSWRCPFRTPK